MNPLSLRNCASERESCEESFITAAASLSALLRQNKRQEAKGKRQSSMEGPFRSSTVERCWDRYAFGAVSGHGVPKISHWSVNSPRRPSYKDMPVVFLYCNIATTGLR